MASQEAVLAALDFKTPTIVCAAEDCWHHAVKLVGCDTPSCTLKFLPTCGIHLLVVRSNHRPAICAGCGRTGTVASILTSRPL